MIAVGVDTDKYRHVVVALSRLGRVLGELVIPATVAGYRELVAWLGGLDGEVVVGIEGAGRYGLAFASRQDTHRYGAAPLPDLPTTGWTMGTTAFERLGITNLELEEYWRKARMGWEDACLPLRWALAFMPAAIWPAIALFASWGPDEAYIRLEAAVTDTRRPTGHARWATETGRHAAG
jgi:hypothetical protein